MLLVGVASAQLPPEPQVNADRTVTFRLADPAARSAAVFLYERPLPLKMKRDVVGLWTATSEPLAPEIYAYRFDVDGRPILDPGNVDTRSSTQAVANVFIVPGASAQPWETTSVPHGVVHRHVFTSKVVLGLDHGQDEFYVYTPPGYDAHAATKYPVLYLLHGWSQTAQDWVKIGHAPDILDNLIAAGKVKPMIVVMPTGYGEMSFVRSGFGVWDDPQKITRNVELFQKSLLTEVIPQAESMYNVLPGRENRAIAGLSMGGLEALVVGLENTGVFASTAGFSAAVPSDPPPTIAALDPKKANLKLLWIACGSSDNLVGANHRFAAALKAHGFALTSIETPGRHDWLVWRDDLVRFAPLLFRSAGLSAAPQQ